MERGWTLGCWFNPSPCWQIWNLPSNTSWLVWNSGGFDTAVCVGAFQEVFLMKLKIHFSPKYNLQCEVTWRWVSSVPQTAKSHRRGGLCKRLTTVFCFFFLNKRHTFFYSFPFGGGNVMQCGFFTGIFLVQSLVLKTFKSFNYELKLRHLMALNWILWGRMT